MATNSVPQRVTLVHAFKTVPAPSDGAGDVIVRHYYRFRGVYHQTLADIVADGERLPMDWLPQSLPYAEIVHFFGFDHEIQKWEMMISHDEGHFALKEDVENPYKFELPQTFPTREEYWAFARSKGLVTVDPDDDSTALDLSLARLYEWIPKMVEEPQPLVFEKVLEIGEWTDRPDVDFKWEPIQPNEVGIPYELWHTLPCRTERGYIKTRLYSWVKAHLEELEIDKFYDSQNGYLSFRGPVVIELGKDQRFLTLLRDIEAPNLEALRLAVEERTELFINLLKKFAPTHTCPKCEGAGVVKCPRCDGNGETDDGVRAIAQFDAARRAVASLEGSRRRDAVREALTVLDRVRKYLC